VNSINLMNAIDDPNLYGDCLIVPLRLSVQAFQDAFAVQSVHKSLDHKLFDIFKRTLLCVAATGALLAVPLALVGVAVKWVDLALRIDQLAHPGSAIDYHLDAVVERYGRLGDRNVAYLNTKFLAEKFELPVRFRPFKGCEMFQFSKDETLVEPRYFKKIVYIKNAAEIESLKFVDKTESTLYLLPFFPYSRGFAGEAGGYIDHVTEWGSFRNRVDRLLQVIKPYNSVTIPEDSYSIALHIRDGGNYDDEKTKTMFPLKLPPMEFYLGELKSLLESDLIPSNKPVFIHIFTDALNPKNVCDQVEKSLSSLTPGERTVTLSYNENATLVDDIANMMNFECVIRSDSNLSGPIAGGSKKVKLDIFPTRFQVDSRGKEIKISRVTKIVTDTNEVSHVNTDYRRSTVTGGIPRKIIEKVQRYSGMSELWTD
jgi:hypothetical protein